MICCVVGGDDTVRGGSAAPIPHVRLRRGGGRRRAGLGGARRGPVLRSQNCFLKKYFYFENRIFQKIFEWYNIIPRARTGVSSMAGGAICRWCIRSIPRIDPLLHVQLSPTPHFSRSEHFSFLKNENSQPKITQNALK